MRSVADGVRHVRNVLWPEAHRERLQSGAVYDTAQQLPRTVTPAGARVLQGKQHQAAGVASPLAAGAGDDAASSAAEALYGAVSYLRYLTDASCWLPYSQAAAHTAATVAAAAAATHTRLAAALRSSGLLEELCDAVLEAPPCPPLPPADVGPPVYTRWMVGIQDGLMLALQDLANLGGTDGVGPSPLTSLLSAPAVRRLRWELLEQVAASVPAADGYESGRGGANGSAADAEVLTGWEQRLRELHEINGRCGDGGGGDGGGDGGDGPACGRWPLLHRETVRLAFGASAAEEGQLLSQLLRRVTDVALCGDQFPVSSGSSSRPPPAFSRAPAAVALMARAARALCAHAEQQAVALSAEAQKLKQQQHQAQEDTEGSAITSADAPAAPPERSGALQLLLLLPLGRCADRLWSAVATTLRGAQAAAVVACAPDLFALRAAQLRLLLAAAPAGLTVHAAAAASAAQPGSALAAEPEAAAEGTFVHSFLMCVEGLLALLGPSVFTGYDPDFPVETGGVWASLDTAGRATCLGRLRPARLMRSLDGLLRLAASTPAVVECGLVRRLLEAAVRAAHCAPSPHPATTTPRYGRSAREAAAAASAAPGAAPPGSRPGGCEDAGGGPADELGLLVTAAKLMRWGAAGADVDKDSVWLPLYVLQVTSEFLPGLATELSLPGGSPFRRTVLELAGMAACAVLPQLAAFAERAACEMEASWFRAAYDRNGGGSGRVSASSVGGVGGGDSNGDGGRGIFANGYDVNGGENSERGSVSSIGVYGMNRSSGVGDGSGSVGGWGSPGSSAGAASSPRGGGAGSSAGSPGGGGGVSSPRSGGGGVNECRDLAPDLDVETVAALGEVAARLASVLAAAPPGAVLEAQPQRLLAALGRATAVLTAQLAAAAAPRRDGGAAATAATAATLWLAEAHKALIRDLETSVLLLCADEQLQAACAPGWLWGEAGSHSEGTIWRLRVGALAATSGIGGFVPPRPVLVVRSPMAFSLTHWRWEDHAKHSHELSTLARAALDQRWWWREAWLAAAGGGGGGGRAVWPPWRLRVCGNPRCANFGAGAEAELRLKSCSGCRAVRYCCADCQKAHWHEGHKGDCARLGAAATAAGAERRRRSRPEL
ncbi:hypothetical protein GPECTOR_58g582 [Gonium pectorale]|uniref:MYND-type domain-containing protein n=1 Tax=Gonium pectorale TaxID=33097 RepID=A0A150G5T9_GONPE|nr:hypothetical protein GPECTOR_58g582 [Gonium pectorale]|eukprot:KXZ45133.1 hypothetical protein GPECTOR_58g582 [Gonium pectorale]